MYFYIRFQKAKVNDTFNACKQANNSIQYYRPIRIPFPPKLLNSFLLSIFVINIIKECCANNIFTLTMTNQYHSTPDAPESNAGDDFHQLWAVRKALELINTAPSALKAIALEGIHPDETHQVDPQGDQLLGIDITEYYGGENFNSAHTIVFSQLKYSTRRADQEWTLNALCKSYKNRKDAFRGSIIHRLASIFKAHSKNSGTDQVIQKMKLKLVSNRGIKDEITTLINNIQFYITKTTSVNLKNLKTHFSSDSDNIDLLRQASKLNNNEFIDFLKLLDFSECGVESRFGQKQKAIEAIKNHTVDGSQEYLKIKELISQKMQPENRDKNLITEKDILYIFGFGSVKELFPAPSSIEVCKHYLERNCYTTLKNHILHSSCQKFYLHAGAGYGKSTFVSHFIQDLPEGSVTITFDCFGGGSYLNPSDRRHKHQWGILQISNNLATQAGTPFLLMRNEAPEVYLRELQKRLQQAIHIIHSQYPNALLVLLIDAADNSLIAAKERGDKCFITDLIQENLPDGCKLLLTTRTSRVELFNFPPEIEAIELPLFSPDETQAYLKSIHPETTEEFINNFHQLTNGNPRVQSYALQYYRTNLEDVLKPLFPNGKNLNEIFSEHINIALNRLGKRKTARHILKYIANLPRPVPLSALQHLSGIKAETLSDFITDLAPGLILYNGEISYRDEDFDAYLKDLYPLSDTDYCSISEKIKQKADQDEYCCLNLAFFLQKAHKHAELQQIVLDQKYLAAITHPVCKKQLLIDRIRMAMQSANDHTDTATFIRLQLLAAESSQINIQLQSLQIQHADLFSLYGLPEYTSSDITFQQSWFGSFYAQQAAVLSCKPEFQDRAKECLKQADSWFYWCTNRIEQEDEEREFMITKTDIANASEAYLNLWGLEKTISYIQRWQPKQSRFSIIQKIACSLLDQNKTDIILEALRIKNIRTDINLLLIECLEKYGISIPDDICLDKVITVLRRFKGDFKHTLKKSLITFIEVLIYKKQKNTIIQNLITLLGDCSIPYLPHFYTSHEKKHLINFDIECRRKALLSVIENTELQTDLFVPDELKEKLASKNSRTSSGAKETHRKYVRLYGFVLPFYRLRAEVYAKTLPPENFKSKFQDIIKKCEDDWELRYYTHDTVELFNFMASRFLDILYLVEPKKEVLSLLQETFIRNKESKKTQILTAIIERISRFHQDELNRLTVQYTKQIDKILCNDLLTLEEVNQYYLRITKALNRIDTAYGNIYFHKAIDAIDKIDTNAIYQIKAIHTFSKIGIPEYSPRLAYELGRYAEYICRILNNDENDLMTEILYTICHLDPNSALAFLCRWDHRNLIQIDHYASEVFEELRRMGKINSCYSAACWHLSPYFYFDNPLLDEVNHNLTDFTRLSLFKEKELFVRELIRNIKLQAHINWKKSYLNQLIAILQKHAVSSSIVTELEHYTKKLHQLYPEAPDEKYIPGNEEVNNWEEYLSEQDFLKTDHLEKIISNIKATLSYPRLTEFLLYVSNKCTLSQQLPFLECICHLNPQTIGYYDFEYVLKSLLQDWKDHPLLSQWIQENTEPILKRWFPFLIENYSDHLTPYIKSIFRAFQLSEERSAAMLKKCLPEYVELIQCSDLYELTELTSIGLSRQDCFEILQTSIQQWNLQIKEDFGDGIWQESMCPSVDINEAITGIFRYLLGHPNKQIRWMASHALRQLVNYSPEPTILKNLIVRQNEDKCIPFQHQPYTYYWLSAKLQLWITLSRIATENPDKLKPFISEIIAEGTHPTFPHLLIQFFVKNTCVALCKAKLTDNSQMILQVIEQPFINEVQESLPNIDILSGNQQFKFDPLDTIPYWFNPLGRYFNLSGSQIAALAENIIYNEWHFDGNIKEREPVHLNDSDWHLTSNDHGDIPKIEKLKTYYEYHSMFCVASRLLKMQKLQDDSIISFQEWLLRHTTAWENYWLSDLRDPEPLLPILRPIDRNDPNWLTTINQQEYENYIGLENNEHIVVNSDITKYIGKTHENISIQAAFVSQDKAPALVRTLHNFENYRWYAIPFSEDDENNYQEQDFILKGFLSQVDSSEGEMEEYDLFTNNLAKLSIVPGKIIITHENLIQSNDQRYTYTAKEKNPVTIFQNWNNTTPQDTLESSSEGFHFMVSKSYMLEILKHYNYCLLIECAVNRSKESFYSEEGGYTDFVTLYLLYPDGQIKYTQRDPEIRKKDY